MLKALLHDRKLLTLLFLTLLIKLLALFPGWVERYYTYGIYPYISRLLRLLLGWIPFSMGDLLYLFAAISLVWAARRFIVLLRRRELRNNLRSRVLRFTRFVLLVYVIFNVFWGLNYNRQGISHQLDLDVARYSTADLTALATRLTAKLNGLAGQVDSMQMLQLNRNRVLFKGGIQAYQQVKGQYPFLEYQNPSVKPSLYSGLAIISGLPVITTLLAGKHRSKHRFPPF